MRQTRGDDFANCDTLRGDANCDGPQESPQAGNSFLVEMEHHGFAPCPTGDAAFDMRPMTIRPERIVAAAVQLSRNQSGPTEAVAGFLDSAADARPTRLSDAALDREVEVDRFETGGLPGIVKRERSRTSQGEFYAPFAQQRSQPQQVALRAPQSPPLVEGQHSDYAGRHRPTLLDNRRIRQD
jgi:hypothetical protein